MKRNVFYRTLHQEAQQYSSEHDIKFEIFHGFADLNKMDKYLELTEDLLAYRYAGVIFAGPPFQLSQTTLVTHPDILRAGVSRKPHFPHIPKVAHDGSFIDRAIERLASLNCRKPAIVSLHSKGMLDRFGQLCETYNMVIDPKRIHVLSREFVEWTDNLVQTLMALPASLRPDSLILTDDLLEEHAIKGLKASGITALDDFPVIALCNYPIDNLNELEVTHLGYDVNECLKLLVQRIFEQRAGKTVPDFTPLPAMFEDEYEKALAAK